MKATELKIGNFLIELGNTPDPLKRIFRITAIYGRDKERFVVEDDNGDMMSAGFLQPIPLTKEWILKSGFMKANRTDIFPESFIMENVMMSRLYLRPSYKGGYYWGFLTQGINDKYETEHEFYDIEQILYVHQLQNLYWCLCGEELKISE
jgi:hypothetical protein